MKQPLDKFSKQAALYKQFRPTYSAALYELLLEHCPQRSRCWDVATGNGQVAVELAKHFEQVEASDISAAQLRQAPQLPNIHYSQQRAEQTNFEEQTFELITVAQAMHWLDAEAFHREVKRVGRPGGRIAIWGYGLLRIHPEIDALMDDFYVNVIGPYWNAARKHIDTAYASISFPYQLLAEPKDLTIETRWTVEMLEGYFNSWSSVQNYKEQHPHENPVDATMQKIKAIWPAKERKQVTFPVFMRIGVINNKLSD